MPTYEYRCTKCGHEFETVHAAGEAVERCERCGGPVRRVFSPPALIFKGSGFHINDYRKTPPASDGDGKGSDKSADKASGKGSGSSKSSTETKSSDSSSSSKSPATSSPSDSKKAS